MYKIEKNDLGFHLTFGGEISKAELPLQRALDLRPTIGNLQIHGG